MDSVGVAPEFIADAVGFEQVVVGPRSGLEHVDQGQADDHRRHGRGHVGEQGLDAHAAQFLDVAQTGHAADDAEQHQGHSDELEQVDENVTERLDVGQGEVVPTHGYTQPCVHDTEQQTNDDLPVEGQFLHASNVHVERPENLGLSEFGGAVYQPMIRQY